MPPSTETIKKAISSFSEIVADVVASRISLARAIERSTLPEIVSALPDDVLISDARIVDEAAFRDWRAASKGIAVILAVVDARSPENRPLALQVSVALAQIEVATRACADVPDGRVFRPAVAAGEAVAAAAEKAGDTEGAGRLLQNLGVLHLDPWLLGGHADNYEQRVAQWQARLHEEYGMKLAGVPLEELRLPDAPAALAAAQAYFRRALPHRRGLDRVRTLKALVQAALLAERLGAAIDREEIGARAQEALGLFREADEPAIYADLLGFLGRLGQPLPEGETDAASQELLDEPLEKTVGRLGFPVTVIRYSSRIGREQARHPPVALQLWEKASGLIPGLNSPPAHADHLNLGLRLILSVYGKIDFNPADAHFLRERADGIIAAVADGRMDRDLAAGALVALACIAPNSDSEAVGLKLLEAARETSPEWTARFDEPIRFLEARNHEGLAVNAYNANRYDQAVPEYIFAAVRFARLGLSPAAVGDLLKANDLIERGNEAVLDGALAALGSAVPTLQAATGPAGIEALRNIFNNVLSKAAAAGKMNQTFATFLWGIVKGAAFSSTLWSPPAWRWDEDEKAADLLRQVAEAQTTAVLPEPAAADGVLDENELLAAYTAPDELASGADARAILENTQHVFDSYVNTRMLADASGKMPWLLPVEHLQLLLDERTVLMNLLLGASPDGRAALYTMLATRESITVACGVLSLPSGTVILVDKEGKRVEADYFTLPVGDVRKKIIANDPAAAETLASAIGNYFGGGLREQLAKFRAEGKDHLCIVPHGPTHYYPFHLVGPAGSPLAADWKVTYLPSMSMLARGTAPEQGNSGQAELRALGVDWEKGNAAGLEELTNASDEARAVASQFGVTAEVNEQATKAALLDALKSARMVHVATHGFSNVAAPAFQSICMKPGDGDSGIVRVYELIGLDLRGCDLITLSACETALGRFDRLDNLRGLPAVLFMAGARTIIGTFWDAETHCSQYFFSVLYERLRAGDTKLDAFSAAQSAAREFYPEYRDWGAFYYAGGW